MKKDAEVCHLAAVGTATPQCTAPHLPQEGPQAELSSGGESLEASRHAYLALLVPSRLSRPLLEAGCWPRWPFGLTTFVSSQIARVKDSYSR